MTFKRSILYFLISSIITILFILSISHARADVAYLQSIPKNQPVLTVVENLKVTAIVKKGSFPFKAIVQTVPKALFVTGFRTAVRLTPYGLGFLAAYELYEAIDGTLTKTVVSNVGDCNYLNTSYGDLNPDACGALIVSMFAPSKVYKETIFGHCPNSSYCLYQAFYTDTSGGITTGGLNVYVGTLTSTELDVPVEDEDISEMFDDYVSSNPEIDHSRAFVDEYGNPIEEMFPDPTYYENPQEDLDLANLYEAGLLQSVDPLLDNYVTPAEYQRIADLHADLNKTPEQQAEELTADAEKPITKAQHAENQVLAEARLDAKEEATGQTVKSALETVAGSQLDYGSLADETWTGFGELLNNTNALPDTSSFMGYFEFTNSASCKTVALPFFGVFPNTSQCDKLHIFRDAFGWFLTFLVAWNMMNMIFKEAN